MSDACVTLLAGLGGALIGASAAIGGQWLDHRHQRRADRRRELVDLVARFWDSTDRLWTAERSLTYTIQDRIASREAGHMDRLQELDEKRLREIADKTEADSEARFLLAQLRLLYPSVVDAASRLRDASANFAFEDRAELDAQRQAALVAYEQAARRQLDSALTAE
jgi:hypothetical protein